MYYKIQPSRLAGNITIPPSKSHTLRAILFASLASGTSVIKNYLSSPDTTAMITACGLLGAKITVENQQLIIIGNNGKPITPSDVIDAGNSGQVLRFTAAVAALTSGYTVLTGDHSIRTNRSIQPLLDGLQSLNVFAVATNNNGFAPVIIKGPLQGGCAILDGQDSQPVSGLLIASAFAKNKTVITVNNPGEKPWIDLTLYWFKKLNINYQVDNYTKYTIMGNSNYNGFEYTVPGDFSSCAFPLMAALIAGNTGSIVKLNNLDFNDCQGDKKLVYTLQDMGAEIIINSSKKTLTIKNYNNTNNKIKKLNGQIINVNNYIDAVPILAVVACFAQGQTVITGAAIARQKESDRLAAITLELSKMGGDITETADGLIIKPKTLIGTRVNSHSDHRIAMALTVAGLAAQSGETIIDNTECVNKSYPNFVNEFKKLGAYISEYSPSGV